jgi:predicted amidohydrolase
VADGRPLVVAVAQPATVPRDVVANARGHASTIEALAGDRPGPAVIVFPELSLTGYHLDAPVVGEGDRWLDPIVEACRRTGSLALVGAPTRAGADTDHLSVLAVDGGGARVAYHKWFLGGDEPARFTPGTGPAVLEVDGWRLGLAVCRDTGVADHAAATAGRGIDAYLAGVCEHDHDHPIVAQRASAIAATHRVWVAMASFAGPTGEGYAATAGRSGIWDPDGAEVARAGPDPGRTVTAVLPRRP